jgi:hypothetical protein
MPTTLYAVLNLANNYTQEIRLTSAVEESYARILANREELIKISFLANSYLLNVDTGTISSNGGLVLAGSKIAYQIKEKPFYTAIIELINKSGDPEELQLVLYLFS